MEGGVRLHVTLELSAVAALAIFPTMWQHIFNDYRGEGARNNLVKLSGFGGSLKTMVKILNHSCSGASCMRNPDAGGSAFDRVSDKA
ncbi:MAG: hypothetical protein V8Q27_05765 [Eubacteriales bacterium]